MHCYQKLKQQFVPPKLKNKLTKKKKYMKTPNEKPKKTHDMKRNQIKHHATPTLFTIAHFPAHVTHKTCALTNKIVSLYVSNCVPHTKNKNNSKTEN